MAKNTTKKSATAVTLGDYTITINQFLHGIEVKGKNEDGIVPKKEDEYLKGKGFWFSKRKKHYWTEFKGDLYNEVLAHYTEQAKKKAKVVKAKKEDVNIVLPINMAKAFPDKPEEEKPKTKTTTKTTTKTKAKAKSTKKSEPTLEEWRDQLLKQTAEMVNSAYDLLKQGKALA